MFRFGCKVVMLLFLRTKTQTMKRLLLLAFCSVFFSQAIFAQCGDDNVLVPGDLTPPGLSQSTSLTFGAGEYVTAYVLTGATYSVTTCGNSAFDTQLTVFDAGGNVLAYNDDYCGLQTTVSFVPTQCGIVKVLLDQYFCNNSGITTPVTMTMDAAPSDLPLITCANDTTIAADSGFCFKTAVVLNQPVFSCAASISHNAPDTFPSGTTTVMWVASSSIGGAYADTCYQNVTIVDDQLPVVTCPADSTVLANVSTCSVVLDLSLVIASDNCGINIISSTPAAGDTLNVGTHSISVTAEDFSGNQSTCSYSITVENTLTVVLDSIVDVACNGNSTGSIVVQASGGTMPFTYDWDNDGSGDNDDTEDLSSLSAGTYVLQMLDSVGCAATLTASISEPAALNLSATSTPQNSTSTPDGSIDLTVSGGVAPYQFDWDNDVTGDFDDTEDLTGLVSGNYTVVVKDENDCSDTLVISVGNATGLVESQMDDFRIFPNPNQGSFWIEMSHESMATIEVYNMLGELVYTTVLTGRKNEMSIEGAEGFLMVKVIQNDQTVSMMRVLIRK